MGRGYLLGLLAFILKKVSILGQNYHILKVISTNQGGL